ncbi:MAG: siderophore-interacting protein [Acidimicrobiales bacterium]
MANTRRDRLRQLRREPPPLRTVTVAGHHERSPRLLRLTLAGDGLRDLVVDQPASSVRLLIPGPGTDRLVMPEWDGNQYLLPTGDRAVLRTFTPLNLDRAIGRLDLDIVRHPGGAVSGWAEAVTVGAPAAISGPARGYDLDPAATRLVALGDETALPALTQVVAAATHPTDGGAPVAVEAHVEVVAPEAVVAIPESAGWSPSWHTAEPGARPGRRLVRVVEGLDPFDEGTRIWAAGEAAAMQAIRTHLFGPRGLQRSHAEVRGYWKARPARM